MENVRQRKLLAGDGLRVRGRQRVEGHHGEGAGCAGVGGARSGVLEQSSGSAFFSLVLTFFLLLSELTVRLSLPEGWAARAAKAFPKLYLPDLLGHYQFSA